MRMRDGHYMLRWLAPLLAAGAILILGAYLVFSGILPGVHATQSARSSQPSQQANSSACVTKFSVSPTSGSVGAPFTVQGSAWPAGKSVGIYLVDPSHHLRPMTLQLLTVPQNGAWSARVTVPGVLVYHAVGDETTSGSAPQTISQTVSPGSYLIYAAAGDAAAFSTASVCPIRFAIQSAGAALTHSSSGAIAGPQTGLASFAVAGRGWVIWLGAGALAALLLLLSAALVLFRTNLLSLARRMRFSLSRNGRRAALSGIALSLALVTIVMMLPLQAQADRSLQKAALVTTTLFSDDFESDAIGAFPAGWSVEAGSNWSVQQNGSQALEQTNTSTATLWAVYAGSATWTDYTVAASVYPGVGSDQSGSSVVAIEGRRQDVNNFYSLLIKNGSEWYLGYKLNGNWVTLANGTMSYTTTTWYNWTLTMTGATISASINGVTLATVTDSTFASGNIGLKTRNQSAFDNVLVTATGSGVTPTPTTTATPSGTPTPTPTTAPTATPTTAPTPTATPFGIGSISGRVTDATSGAGIAGARISTVPSSTTVTTNNQGNFVLQNVNGNTYDVVMTASGYNENHIPGVVVTNNTIASANASLKVIPGATAMDLFTQPNQSGWNPSSDGSTWTDDASTYPGAVVSVQNNLGFTDTYTAANDRDEWMGPSYADQQVSGDFVVSQFGQDAYQHGARLLGRVKDGHTFIDFAINYATSTLQIWVNQSENWTMMSQVNVPALQTGQWYHAKLLTVGAMSYGKVWAYNAPEPAWQISGNQTLLTTGSGGVRSTYCVINWNNISVQGVTTITGLVKNTSGIAIAGATVSDGHASVTTDSSGRYVLIEPNSNATYTVTASASGHSTKSSSATTTSLKSTTLNFTL